MTPKQRVLTTLRKQEPDRVPIFANLTPQVAEKLGKQLNLLYGPEDSFLSTRTSHTEILVELGNDAVGIGAGRAADAPSVVLPDGRIRDEWGIIYSPIGLYSEAVERPLADIEDVSDLDNYRFPKADAPGRFATAEKMVQTYGDQYAVIATLEATMFEMAWNLVGLEKYLVDLMQKRPYALRILDELLVYSIGCGQQLIELGADVIWTGDDFGTQQGMMLSPKLWREVFKPRFRQLFAELRRTRPDILIAYHSCGSIRPIIDDMMEIGLDILNPIQPQAVQMDLAELKKTYGDRLAFFGGIDIQGTLPNGTPEQVKAEVRERIRTAGVGGGYLLAPAHNIQPDTPIENIYAMFEAVKEYGPYPLSTGLFMSE